VVLGTTMLRDDRDSGAERQLNAHNVLGEPLEICSMRPMTGFHRDGCCNTGREDVGSHTVCAVMTDAFLDFSKSRGNDLSTPVPELGFPGLKPGDRWCFVCAPLAGSIRSKSSAPCRLAHHARGLLLTRRSQTPSRWREPAHSESNIQQITKTDDQVPHDRRGLLGASR
jgi:uncharacterized protein